MAGSSSQTPSISTAKGLLSVPDSWKGSAPTHDDVAADLLSIIISSGFDQGDVDFMAEEGLVNIGLFAGAFRTANQPRRPGQAVVRRRGRELRGPREAPAGRDLGARFDAELACGP